MLGFIIVIIISAAGPTTSLCHEWLDVSCCVRSLNVAVIRLHTGTGASALSQSAMPTDKQLIAYSPKSITHVSP